MSKIIDIKEVKKEKRDRVYVMGENPKSIFPVLDDWHKIGKSDADAGNNNGPDDWHERTRALNQGNPRGLVAKHQKNVKGSAGPLEDAIHEELDRRGVRRLIELTGETGHKEWRELTEEEAIAVVDEVYEKLYGTMEDLFENEDGSQVVGY